MEKLVKIKFIPFIFGLVVLITGLYLKYILQIYVEYTIIKWGIFLTIAGFIFLRVIQQTVNEKLEKEQNHEPEKSVQEIETDELRDELYQIKNRGFPASFIRHFFGTLVALGGISIIIGNKEYLFGLILFAASMILNVISLRWTVKYFKRYKELKMTLKDDKKIY
jgi:uncharacterized membrane protein